MGWTRPDVANPLLTLHTHLPKFCLLSSKTNIIWALVATI